MRAEADARAAREETMWRDAYTKRVEEKRQRWDEWDDMAAEEDTARKDRVARTNSRKPGSKTPSQRRDRLAKYRDISRRADETWAASIERRWTADESYARTTGYKPRGDGVDRTMDWLFTPLAGAARKIDALLDSDEFTDFMTALWGELCRVSSIDYTGRGDSHKPANAFIAWLRDQIAAAIGSRWSETKASP